MNEHRMIEFVQKRLALEQAVVDQIDQEIDNANEGFFDQQLFFDRKCAAMRVYAISDLLRDMTKEFQCE